VLPAFSSVLHMYIFSNVLAPLEEVSENTASLEMLSVFGSVHLLNLLKNQETLFLRFFYQVQL